MKAESKFNKLVSNVLDIDRTTVSSGPLASALGIKVRLWSKPPATLNSDSLGLSVHMLPNEALELAQEIYRVTLRYVIGQGNESVPDCPGPLDPAVLEHCWTTYQQGQASASHSAKQVFGQTLQSLAAWMQERSQEKPAGTVSLTKKEVMQMAGYNVHSRQSHVGQRYDYTFPGKTGMQNHIFASEEEAETAMEKQFDADVLCARALVNVVSAAGFMSKAEG